VRLAWHVQGEKRGYRGIDLASDGAGSETIPAIVALTRYWVEGRDGVASDTFAVRPLEPLLVEQLRVVLTYPAHLRRPPDSLAAPLPTLVVPAGTTIELSGHANYVLAEAWLAFRPLEQSPASAERPGSPDAPPASSWRLDVTAQRFGGRIEPAESGEWIWRLRAVDAPGEPVTPAPIETLVVPDLPPRVRVLFPAADTALLAEAVLPLIGEAQDDIGLQAIELVSWLGSAPREEEGARVERVGPERAGDTRALVRPVLDLGDRDLLPGDTVYYFLRAIDANPTHSSASSDTFGVWLPTLADMGVARARQVSELASATDALEMAAGELERAAREEARRATSPETGDPPRRAPDSPDVSSEAMSESSAVQDRSEELGRELQELQSELERLRSELASSRVSDPSLEEELAGLADDWRPDPSEQLEAASRELHDRLRAGDRTGARDALERLAQEARALRDQLQAASSRLEMAALEQSLKASRAEAAELAARQEAVTAAIPNEADWAEREENLAGEAEALAERLEDVQKQLERARASEAAESARVAGERAELATEQMREAARLAAGEERDAGEVPDAGQDEPRAAQDPTAPGDARQGAEQRARNATENLQRAAEALEEAGSEMSRERDDTALETLARARAEALQLAGEEQALLEARPDEPAAGRQGALRQGLDNLARRLAEAREAGAIANRALTTHIDAATRAMDAAIERLAETGRSVAAARAHGDAIEALNELALQLLETEQSRSSASAGAAGQDARERMSALAQHQGGVTERTRALQPLQADGRDVRPQAEQLAREQARIAEELESLNQGDDEWLGEPEALAREARELTDRLAAGRVDTETLDRQRGLFRRMLDAGRSLEQGEPDTERRESRTGEAIVREVPELDPRLLAGPRFPRPEAAALGRLPAYYRRMVLEYFDRLNDAVSSERDRARATEPVAGERGEEGGDGRE
jgi:hypothetical protein